MRFSVVVPVFNADAYLSACLESVLRQTFTDYEVIVVDDGSTDGSGAIADGYSNSYKQVRVLHCENQGPFLARRQGIKSCTGDYVVFLDADDALRGDALDIISSHIDDTHADIVSFRFSRCDDFSTKDGLSILASGLYCGKEYELFKQAVCSGLSVSLWGKAIRLCRIDVSADYGALKKFRLAEDLYQLLYIVDSASSFAHTEDVLYYYRTNDSSSTAKYKHTYIDDTERVAKSLIEFGRQWEMGDAAIGGALRLYVSLSKIFADSSDDFERCVSKRELAQISASLSALAPSVSEAVSHMRFDYRVLLRAVLANSLSRLRFVTEASHLGRKVLGRGI